MMDFKKLAMNFRFVNLVEFKNWTGAASTGDSFSMMGYQHATIIIVTGAWAAGTAAVTLTQDTSVTATGSVKALAFTEMWTGCVLATDAVLTRTAVAANTFNLAAANTMYVIEVDAETLDRNTATKFDCVTLNVATPGANADIYGAIALLGQQRYVNSGAPNPLTDTGL